MATLNLKGRRVLIITRRGFRYNGTVDDETPDFLIVTEPRGTTQILRHEEIERIQIEPDKTPPDPNRDQPFWEARR